MTDYDCALVRGVPQSYAPAYAAKSIYIDAALADAQHTTYVTALEEAGLRVTTLAADEAFYDCVFVEDTAVVWRDHALITRMAEHREGEQRAVLAALESSHRVSRLSPGSRLEGGDVLHTDDTTYVGLTSRTNQRGADELAEFLGAFRRRVVPVPVSGVLHLKTAATYLGNGALLTAPGHVETRLFDVDDVLETAAGEPNAANCVRVRNTLLIRSGFPQTIERVRGFAAGHAISVALLDLSEFEKGDGSATCLSLLWRESA